MDHLGYLCTAYTIIWVVILGYFIGLSRRERRIWEEIRTIREQLDRSA
jgi:CcmD family protein